MRARATLPPATRARVAENHALCRGMMIKASTASPALSTIDGTGRCLTSSPVILLTCLVSGICAFLAARRQRACGRPRRLLWGTFVFMLGSPGYVGERRHRRWSRCGPRSRKHRKYWPETERGV